MYILLITCFKMIFLLGWMVRVVRDSFFEYMGIFIIYYFGKKNFEIKNSY